MSERKVDIVVGNPGASASGQVPIKDLNREQRRARRAQVLERGLIGERMHVTLPEDRYGEWVHNSKEEIYRMESLGYWIDTEHATKRALHSEGDSKAIVGDVIFMVCDRETREDIEWARKQQFDRVHGNPNEATKRTAEEIEYANTMKTEPAIPAIIGGSQQTISGAELASQLGK